MRSERSTGKLPLWKGLLTATLAIAIFFGLLELFLYGIGVRPLYLDEDPFVGFADNVPLFVENTDPNGERVFETAPNKRLFNSQRFPATKAPGAYRIFCLGGSTTYGRPYDDAVSFPGWLRELLRLADPDRTWEVINCGGISYASYRVANLTRELARYEPDLFIVYSGHNEFLEERSYRGLRKIPAPIRATAALLSRTRTWAALGTATTRLGITPGSERDQRAHLREEVDTKLENFGPAIYKRDDALSKEIHQHYELSLRRIEAIARAAGAEVVFVTPASNLKDCSPFKSEHSEGLEETEWTRSEALQERAAVETRAERWPDALATLEEAIELDPRYAELHYRRGRALLALERYDEAEAALRRARDEDVCPLRLLSTMEEIVERVAKETEHRLIDFPTLLEKGSAAELGHSILGEEFFLDHVHPTTAGNRLLAIRILEEMIAEDILTPGKNWKDSVIPAADAIIERRFDPVTQARGLANLANVLAWAGKTEDASRPALRALASGVTDPEVILSATSVLADHYAHSGDLEKEIEYRRMAFHAAPTSPELHFKAGLRLLELDPPDLELALGHLFSASVFWSGPNRDEPHRMIAKVMAERGRFAAALSHLLEAEKIKPEHPETVALLAEIRHRLGPAESGAVPLMIDVQRNDLGTPERIVQVRPGPENRYLPDVLWTEWYEGGELRRYVDYVDGVAHGVDKTWDPNGKVVSQRRYRSGRQIDP